MKKQRSNTKLVLIDIQFYDSMNEFEYQYGDFISYKEMEQKSYIEFKEIMFNNICKEIKFRKFGRFGKILTIKAEMLKNEIDKFRNLLELDEISITYGWIISNVTLIKDNKVSDQNPKFKKIKISSGEDDEDSDEDEIEDEEEIDSYDEF